MVKPFSDDTFLFSMAHNISASAKEINEELNKINNWPFQWKMSFYSDGKKQAQEVLFSRKLHKVSHPKLIFNNTDVSRTNSQHLGVVLDSKLNFHDHLEIIFSKVQNYLPFTQTK